MLPPCCADRRYSPYRAYCQSKLANLLFMHELQRRAQAAGASPASLAAHPRYAATNLQAVGPQMSDSPLQAWATEVGNRLLSQPAAQGAWPSLRAAGDPAAAGGQFYGPGGFAGLRGSPRVVSAARHATDPRTPPGCGSGRCS